MIGKISNGGGGSSENVHKWRAPLNKRKTVVASLQCAMIERTEAKFQFCVIDSWPLFPPL